MAEDQNNKPENNDDENDPYKFFKFAGPSENNDNDRKKKDTNKKN